MTSTAQPDTLSDIRAIVKTDDAQTLQLAETLLAMDDSSLIGVAADALAYIAEKRKQLEEQIAKDVLTHQLATAFIRRRIEQRGGRAIPDAAYRCELVSSKKIEKRFDVLQRLVALVPADELSEGKQPALALIQHDPEWVAHAGKLRALAKKYGGDVAAVVEQGVVDVDGPATLVIEPRELPKAVNA